MGVHEHRKSAAEDLGCAVLTVSDTRRPRDDESGDLISDRLTAAGHRVVRREIVKDDPEAVSKTLAELAADQQVAAIISNGGTGLGGRDNTHEAVSRLLTKRLDGFGELFRWLSYEEVGAAAMLSRAVAGTIKDTPVFCLPGSPAACRLAMDKLVLPELGHIVTVMRS